MKSNKIFIEKNGHIITNAKITTITFFVVLSDNFFDTTDSVKGSSS